MCKMFLINIELNIPRFNFFKKKTRDKFHQITKNFKIINKISKIIK